MSTIDFSDREIIGSAIHECAHIAANSRGPDGSSEYARIYQQQTLVAATQLSESDDLTGVIRDLRDITREQLMGTDIELKDKWGDLL